MQSKSSEPDTPTKDHGCAVKRGSVKRGTSLVDFGHGVHPKTRMVLNPFKAPCFSAVALIFVAMLLVVNGHSLWSAHVNEDSNNDDNTFPTKTTDGGQQFQHEDFAIHEEERLSKANDVFLINYKENTENSNFVLKQTIDQQRQLLDPCTRFQDFVSCNIAQCKWTRRIGCMEPHTPVPSTMPSMSSIPS
eukprot:15354866-Ditylum_brightwellii.AAC.1